MQMLMSKYLWGALATISVTTPSLSQSPLGNDGFLVAGLLRQGMSQGEFDDLVRANGLNVTSPFADKSSKQLKLRDTSYLLAFCDGTLTYASWVIDENSDFIKSINHKVAKEGFEVVSVYVQSDYSDSAKMDVNVLTIRLSRTNTPYSIKYSLFDTNGQVAFEDTRYDDTYGCGGDPGEK